ncbi:MAG TPA: hypothetical protein VGF02_13130 [Pseudolabrys sp.]
MIATPSFLDDLQRAADGRAAAEEAFRREIAVRTKALENERAFAFRRLNLMRAIAEVVAGAEDEAIAVAAATAVLRAKLGWETDSEARDVVITQFAPVAVAMFASLSPAPPETTGTSAQRPPPDVIATLAAFERWYAETHPGPFWVLLENYMTETPVVDF